jgi:lysozyme
MTDYNTLYKYCFNLLVAEEGFKETPYYCTEGFPTIGIGFRIGNKGDPLPQGRRMTLEEAQAALRYKIKVNVTALERQLPVAWSKCNLERKATLISMVFQLGLQGFLGFRNTIAALERAEWHSVASNMLDSRWARQTPNRAHRHATVMLEGDFGVYWRQGYGDLSK